MEEVIQRIDPELRLVRQFSPSSLLVYQVEKGGSLYVLKAASLSEDRSLKMLLNEKEILATVSDVQGITHLVRDYGEVGGYAAILKEYFEGKTLRELWKEFNGKKFKKLFKNDKLKQSLERTVSELHSRWIAYLDITRRNIAISPDRREAKLIDIGTAQYDSIFDFFRELDLDCLRSIYAGEDYLHELVTRVINKRGR